MAQQAARPRSEWLRCWWIDSVDCRISSDRGKRGGEQCWAWVVSVGGRCRQAEGSRHILAAATMRCLVSYYGQVIQRLHRLGCAVGSSEQVSKCREERSGSAEQSGEQGVYHSYKGALYRGCGCVTTECALEGCKRLGTEKRAGCRGAGQERPGAGWRGGGGTPCHATLSRELHFSTERCPAHPFLCQDDEQQDAHHHPGDSQQEAPAAARRALAALRASDLDGGVAGALCCASQVGLDVIELFALIYYQHSKVLKDLVHLLAGTYGGKEGGWVACGMWLVGVERGRAATPS